MSEDFQKFLVIYREDQALIAHRFSELKDEFKNELKAETQKLYQLILSERETNDSRFSELRSEMHKVLKIALSEQELNSHRYNELKSELTDINLILPTLATKGQLNQVYESLSQDMAYFSGGHMKLKKRVDGLEKRVKRLEDRTS